MVDRHDPMFHVGRFFECWEIVDPPLSILQTLLPLYIRKWVWLCTSSYYHGYICYYIMVESVILISLR